MYTCPQQQIFWLGVVHSGEYSTKQANWVRQTSALSKTYHSYFFFCACSRFEELPGSEVSFTQLASFVKCCPAVTHHTVHGNKADKRISINLLPWDHSCLSSSIHEFVVQGSFGQSQSWALPRHHLMAHWPVYYTLGRLHPPAPAIELWNDLVQPCVIASIPTLSSIFLMSTACCNHY